MRRRPTWPPGLRDEISVDDALVLPATLLQIELAELGHVDGAQSKAPSSRVSAGLVPEPPLDILEAERGKQNFTAIAEQVRAGRCGHDRIGNRGVTIAVVVALPGLMDERRIQGKLQAVGGPIDRMARRILVVLEPR
jgi:hypothetical protein